MELPFGRSSPTSVGKPNRIAEESGPWGRFRVPPRHRKRVGWLLTAGTFAMVLVSTAVSASASSLYHFRAPFPSTAPTSHIRTSTSGCGHGGSYVSTDSPTTGDLRQYSNVYLLSGSNPSCLGAAKTVVHAGFLGPNL